MFPGVTFDKVYYTWGNILYDLVRPNGRSVYDTFWQSDRSFFSGITFLIIACVLLAYSILHYIIHHSYLKN